MKAVRENREYSIDEAQKESYIRDGFDIYDETGKKIADGKGKTVTQEAYDALMAELEEALHQNGSGQEETLLPILKEYASLKGIDIGKASTVKGILDKIREAGDS